MSLYLHVDRLANLEKLKRPVVQLERYEFRTEGFLSILSPALESGLIQSLESTFEEGLSYHGAAYFVQLVQMVNPETFGAFIAELYFEHVRQRDFVEKPSRLQSLFAWDDLSIAVEFLKKHNGDIYKVSPCGLCSKHDMNLLNASFDADEMEQRASLYWRGLPMSTDKAYAPKWEFLLKCPVEIIGKVS